MASYRSRPFAGEDDFAAMQALASAAAGTGLPDYGTPGDLDWWRCTDDNPERVRDAQLWFADDGSPVGFAWPRDKQVDIISHPAHVAVEAEMLAWSEEWARARGVETFTAWAYTRDAARNRLLTERGYVRSEEHFTYHRRALTGALPAGDLPEGYQLRHVTGEADLEQRVAVHRDAFAPSRMTVEKHRRVRRAAYYRPELDLVVVAPDGSFAAFCIVWYDAATQIGAFEPVGCHSAHRRRGLATAVLAEGMRRLCDLGAKYACVNSAGGNAASAGLYTSVGLLEIDRDYAWRVSL